MRAKTKPIAFIVLGFTLVMATAAVAQEKNPERNAYFGETHVHTSWSFDAWLFGDRITGPGRRLQVLQGRDDQGAARLRHQDRPRHWISQA